MKKPYVALLVVCVLASASFGVYRLVEKKPQPGGPSPGGGAPPAPPK